MFCVMKTVLALRASNFELEAVEGSDDVIAVDQCCRLPFCPILLSNLCNHVLILSPLHLKLHIVT